MNKKKKDITKKKIYFKKEIPKLYKSKKKKPSFPKKHKPKKY